MSTIEDSEYKNKKLGFWNDVYGIDMTCIKKTAIQEPLIDVCEDAAVNSTPCKIFEIDLYTVTKQQLDFSSAYSVTMTRSDTVHGLIAWFDIVFDKLPNKVEFSTGPHSLSTHWKQTIFYTKTNMIVEKGDVVEGSIAVRKSRGNFRELDVKISFHHESEGVKHNFYQLYKVR